jgi:ribonuclease HI
VRLEVWTDGGCSGNPGPGGWAFVLVGEKGRILKEAKGGEPSTTNNRMELLAVINALEHLAAEEAAPEKITVYTDSEYVKNGISVWIHNWKKNGWRTANKKPVKNEELWKRLDSAAALFPVSWQWVKGHAGTPLNERCDQMTQEAIALFK